MPFSFELREALHGDGVPLRELFRMHVSEDRELSGLLHAVEGFIFDGEHCCDCLGTLDGLLTPAHSSWPPSIQQFDLVSEWLDGDGTILGLP